MKVISKPDISNWSYKYQCKNCDSELEVEAKDINHHHYSGDMREPSSDSYSAICEVCKGQFSIPADCIPKLIKIDAEKRSASNNCTSYYDR